MRYGYKKQVSIPYQEAVDRTKEELNKEGFGILTEIDVKATLRKKLNVDYDDYIILGACNPPFAKKALDLEREIGLLLPCNVIIQELEGGKKTKVAAIDPEMMFKIIDNAKMEPIALEVRVKLQRVITSLAG